MARWIVALALVCALFGAAPPAGAQSDQSRGIEAVSTGKARPLKEILAVLRRQFPGEVLDAQLVEREGSWFYRIKLLGGDGKVQELTVDARTAAVIEQR
jgi:uncharacterized membrane protein YkoI